MYLADTNIVSELMRPRPDSGVLQWLQRLELGDMPLVVSAITVDEMILGLHWRPQAEKMRWFEHFLMRATVLPVNADIARRAGEWRAQFARRGVVRSQADMLIAATAQGHALTLVTRNVRDFDGCGIALLNPFSVAA